MGRQIPFHYGADALSWLAREAVSLKVGSSSLPESALDRQLQPCALPTSAATRVRAHGLAEITQQER